MLMLFTKLDYKERNSTEEREMERRDDRDVISRDVIRRVLNEETREVELSDILQQANLASEIFQHLSWREMLNMREVFSNAYRIYVGHLQNINFTTDGEICLEDELEILEETRNLRKLDLAAKCSLQQLVRVISQNQLLTEINGISIEAFTDEQQLRNLTHLTIYSSDRTTGEVEEFFTQLSQSCTHLSHLTMIRSWENHFNFTPSSLRSISQLPLRSFKAFYVDFSELSVEPFDQFFANLDRISKLESIELDHCEGAQQLILAVAKNCHNLITFRFDTSKLDDRLDEAIADLTDIIRCNPRLRCFHALSDCPGQSTCDEPMLEQMLELEHLEMLDLQYFEDNLSDLETSFFRLLHKFPSLKTIQLQFTSLPQKWVNEIGLRCRNIEGLYLLALEPYTDEVDFVGMVENNPQIQRFEIDLKVNLSSESYYAITKCKKLQYLMILLPDSPSVENIRILENSHLSISHTITSGGKHLIES